jgi:hypothetical protein
MNFKIMLFCAFAILVIVLTFFIAKQMYNKSNHSKQEGIDLGSIPWEELLKPEVRNLGEFEEKYFHNRNIYPSTIELLQYILLQCSDQSHRKELYWEIFHRIGDELLDAGPSAEFCRFCWIKCIEDPLLFYRRYCQGDKQAIRGYYNAFRFNPANYGNIRDIMTKEDVNKINKNICELIRNAKHLQPDDAQRNKDAMIIEKYLVNSGASVPAMNSKTLDEPAKDKPVDGK